MGGIAKKPALHLDVGVDLAEGPVKCRNQRLEFDRHAIKGNRFLRCRRIYYERTPRDAFDAARHEARGQDCANRNGCCEGECCEKDREEISKQERRHDLAEVDLRAPDHHHQFGIAPPHDGQAECAVLIERVEDGETDRPGIREREGEGWSSLAPELLDQVAVGHDVPQARAVRFEFVDSACRADAQCTAGANHRGVVQYAGGDLARDRPAFICLVLQDDAQHDEEDRRCGEAEGERKSPGDRLHEGCAVLRI